MMNSNLSSLTNQCTHVICNYSTQVEKISFRSSKLEIISVIAGCMVLNNTVDKIHVLVLAVVAVYRVIFEQLVV